MDIPERRLSAAEVQALSLPLQNDLIAIFGVIGDAADRLLDKAITEGWTPETFIDELVRMIEGDNRAPETVAMPKVEELKVNKAETLKALEKNLQSLVVMKSKRWVSTHETGSHLLINGKGDVLAGAGGKLTKKPEEKKPEKKKESAPKKKEKIKGEKLKIDWSPITDELKDSAKWFENLPSHPGA